jgi:hypothetical protein
MPKGLRCLRTWPISDLERGKALPTASAAEDRRAEEGYAGEGAVIVFFHTFTFFP